MKSFGFVLFFLLLGIAQVSRPVWGSRWSRTGDFIVGTNGEEAAGLTDGREMVLGGDGNLDGYQIFSPATGTWVSGSLPATDGRWGHNIAMLLPDGNVLFIPPTGLWLYDPRAGSWISSAVNTGWEMQSCATLLKDGDVLLMYDSKKCQLYHYATDAVTPVGATQALHSRAVEVLLPDGKVLIIGGYDDYWPSGSRHKICELYDPGTRTWSITGPLLEERGANVAVLLPPPWQKVLVAGPLKKCELYDIGGKTWSYTDDLDYSSRSASTMALLPSGKVLMAGGGHGNEFCELYDPVVGTWSITDTMEVDRSHFSMAILPTGKTLASGDYYRNPICEIYDPSEGVWDTRPSLCFDRMAHTATPLPIIPTENCSTNVLIVGGENSSGALKSCELYNYSLDHVTLTDELTETRSHHTAVLLVSGQVLVAGGKDGVTTRSSSELYDVPTQLWTTTGAMINARFDHTATLLKNGDVLATGGEDAGTYLSSCETYSGGIWTPTASAMATQRTRHSAILLRNGDILVIGGQTTGGGATVTCELWNGTTWTGKAPMSTARYWHTATLLQSGKVLVMGGTTNGGTPLSNCEVYDPDLNSWTTEGDLNTARFQHNATLLYSGLVLATGGNGGVSSCETYDPATHKWTTDYTGTLITGRSYHSSVLIPDTMPFILAIGGRDGGGGYLRSVEEYDVGLGYRKEWQSEITNYPAVTLISPSMNITGTLFRGVSEADGGNYCHIVSNDHPIISLMRVGGGNWQGNGGGEILDMPLSSSWDTAHTTVHPKITDFQGYYRLWSIVNGIPSKWYEACDPEGVEEGTNSQLSISNGQLTVYPNPGTTRSGVHFRLGLSTVDRGLLTLAIYDLAGRLVRSLPIHHSPLTIHQLKPGIYFYRVARIIENRGFSDCPPPSGGAHTIKGKFTVVQ